MSENVTVIRPSRRWVSLGLRELWDYRELLYFLVWRDLKGRYRQMALGPLWLVIRPMVTLLIFTFVFGSVARIPSEGLPYPLFAFAALVPWQFFSSSTSGSANSLVSHLGVISKVYFPRLVLPMAVVIAGLIEMAVSLLAFTGLMLWYRVYPTANVFVLPVYVIMAAATSLATGLWLASLSVRFRDVSFAVGYLMQAWLFLSPVIYPSGLVPHGWRWLYSLNPMVPVIEGFRWCLLDTGRVPASSHLIAGSLVMVALVVGALVFRRTDQTVVDLL